MELNYNINIILQCLLLFFIVYYSFLEFNFKLFTSIGCRAASLFGELSCVLPVTRCELSKQLATSNWQLSNQLFVRRYQGNTLNNLDGMVSRKKIVYYIVLLTLSYVET